MIKQHILIGFWTLPGYIKDIINGIRKESADYDQILIWYVENPADYPNGESQYTNDKVLELYFKQFFEWDTKLHIMMWSSEADDV